jgi:hypothetical protein
MQLRVTTMSLSSSPQHLSLQVKSCVSLPAMSLPRIGHTVHLHEPQLSFPSARNAHQRTVGALSILYHRALLRFSDSGKHSFAYPAGMLVLLSLTAHWTTSAHSRQGCQYQQRAVAVVIFHAVLSLELSNRCRRSQPASLPCLNTVWLWIEIVMYRWLADDLRRKTSA